MITKEMIDEVSLIMDKHVLNTSQLEHTKVEYYLNGYRDGVKTVLEELKIKLAQKESTNKCQTEITTTKKYL